MKSILTIIFSFLLVVSGLAQTRNVVVGTNDVIVSPTNFWSANASNGRTGLGLGSAATNPASAFQPSSSVLSNLASSNAVNLTNLNASNLVGVIPASNIATVNFTNVAGTLAIGSGGTGATNAGGARTNLGLGATWLTNTNVTNFKNATELQSFRSPDNYAALYWGDVEMLSVEDAVNVFYPIYWSGTNGAANAATTRANLGLGWSALTNSNAGTGLVSVNTNGEVVSPTNFWQSAPIQTLVQDFTGITVSQTNNATNARNVYVYSLATNVSGISNTIILPTNTLTFNGDEVTVIHKGTTNTTTVIRQAGSTNNFITINRFDESVKFIRELGQWDFYHNISFVEPIQFSGTNATANAAASRTNLGLGVTNRPLFNGVVVGDIANNPTTAFIANSQSDEVHYAPDGITFYSQTNASHNIDMANAEFNNANTWTFNSAIGFGTTTNAAATRTNLGIPLAALTNTSVTNFQKAIFYTNTAPSNIGGNLGTIAAWIEIVASNGVTYKIPAYTNVP